MKLPTIGTLSPNSDITRVSVRRPALNFLVPGEMSIVLILCISFASAPSFIT